MYQLEVLKDKVQDAVFALTSCICQPSATIKVNGRSFKILRILGEGGFSFVYLAQDEHSGVSDLFGSITLPALIVVLRSASLRSRKSGVPPVKKV